MGVLDKYDAYEADRADEQERLRVALAKYDAGETLDYDEWCLVAENGWMTDGEAEEMFNRIFPEADGSLTDNGPNSIRGEIAGYPVRLERVVPIGATIYWPDYKRPSVPDEKCYDEDHPIRLYINAYEQGAPADELSELEENIKAYYDNDENGWKWGTETDPTIPNPVKRWLYKVAKVEAYRPWPEWTFDIDACYNTLDELEDEMFSYDEQVEAFQASADFIRDEVAGPLLRFYPYDRIWIYTEEPGGRNLPLGGLDEFDEIA